MNAVRPTVQVVMCNDNDEILAEKNITFSEEDLDEVKQAIVQELKNKNVIVIDLGDGPSQYVY